jgi:hypothetical protein
MNLPDIFGGLLTGGIGGLVSAAVAHHRQPAHHVDGVIHGVQGAASNLALTPRAVPHQNG